MIQSPPCNAKMLPVQEIDPSAPNADRVEALRQAGVRAVPA